jgi:hypothetical protein
MWHCSQVPNSSVVAGVCAGPIGADLTTVSSPFHHDLGVMTHDRSIVHWCIMVHHTRPASAHGITQWTVTVSVTRLPCICSVTTHGCGCGGRLLSAVSRWRCSGLRQHRPTHYCRARPLGLVSPASRSVNSLGLFSTTPCQEVPITASCTTLYVTRPRSVSPVPPLGLTASTFSLEELPLVGSPLPMHAPATTQCHLATLVCEPCRWQVPSCGRGRCARCQTEQPCGSHIHPPSR